VLQILDVGRVGGVWRRSELVQARRRRGGEGGVVRRIPIQQSF
jgi:hypothetical protein